MISEKGKGVTTFQRRISCLLGSGLMISRSAECTLRLKMRMHRRRVRNLIFLIITHSLICLRFSLRIQQVCLMELWKLSSKDELDTELSTSLLMKCSQSRSLKICNELLTKHLKVKISSTCSHSRLASVKWDFIPLMNR